MAYQQISADYKTYVVASASISFVHLLTFEALLSRRCCGRYWLSLFSSFCPRLFCRRLLIKVIGYHEGRVRRRRQNRCSGGGVGAGPSVNATKTLVWDQPKKTRREEREYYGGNRRSTAALVKAAVGWETGNSGVATYRNHRNEREKWTPYHTVVTRIMWMPPRKRYR